MIAACQRNFLSKDFSVKALLGHWIESTLVPIWTSYKL